MDIESLKDLLDLSNRQDVYRGILKSLKKFDDLKYVKYEEFKISDGMIPILRIPNDIDINEVKHVKMFVGCQHNEYNGLFGIIEFLKMIREQKINMQDIFLEEQVLLFFPLMNPYGFLNPRSDNKSGYYLKNGSNLNRFWRRIFVPEYRDAENELNQCEFPDQGVILKNILKNYWENENITIYILDFHETSLLYRFPKELSMELTNYYKFDHWLKEAVIENIIELYNIQYFRKPLFYKCNPSADHDHINMSTKQIDTVLEKLREYMSQNQGKLSFYFCYSEKSEEYCIRLANIVRDKLKDKLWESQYPAYDHKFHDHGCLVKMNDATSRERVFCMELESQKQFFNIFDEIEKSKNDPFYLEKKLNSINLSLMLVIETIRVMINLFE